MAPNSVILDLFEEAFERKTWHGPNLWQALKGVSAKQAAWRPVPLRHNIWEETLHAAYWKYAVRRRLQGGQRGSFVLKGSNFFPRPEAGKLTEAAFAEWVETEQVLLGWDCRKSSPGLADAFTEGATSRGVEVVHLGLIATDMLYFASGKLEVPGVVITASHNPPRYNGLKFCRARCTFWKASGSRTSSRDPRPYAPIMTRGRRWRVRWRGARRAGGGMPSCSRWAQAWAAASWPTGGCCAGPPALRGIWDT